MTSLLLILYEAQEVIDLRIELRVSAENLACVIQPHSSTVEQPVGVGQGVDHIGRKVVAFQGNHVDAARPSGVALDEHVRRYVVQDSTEPTDKAIATDRRIVMNAHAARKRRMVMDVNVAS